jgi:hypothetical protein
VTGLVEPGEPRFFGKYRGIVEDNADPEQRGRLCVSIPALLGTQSKVWADPCSPYADDGAGVFIMPPRGAQVWIDFEEGDLERPVWVGCFWRPRQAPSRTAKEAVIAIGGTTVTIAAGEGPGRLTIMLGQGSHPTTLALTEESVEIKVGGSRIELTSNGIVLGVGNDRLTVAPGKIEAATAAGASVKLTGPKVTVNDTALEVI